jgi:hypothetical protein
VNSNYFYSVKIDNQNNKNDTDVKSHNSETVAHKYELHKHFLLQIISPTAALNYYDRALNHPVYKNDFLRNDMDWAVQGKIQREGRATDQVVSRRPLAAEAWVRSRVNPCGICGGQNGTGTGFSPSSLVLPCQYHSTVAVQTHIIWGMRNMPT